jgi:pimeloyl-ACP methyl ester carboxylesterase
MNRTSLLLLLVVTGCQTTLQRQVVTLEDGRRVELATGGETGPIVVFEAGLGGDWTHWDAVAGPLSKHARLFAYSRPGTGASSSVSTPRDPQHIADELRALLTSQGLVPPYVLVGHSFGGAYLEYFAKAHPTEVSALVLVDPRHRDFSAQCEAAGLDGCGLTAATVKGLPQVQQNEVAGYALAAEQNQGPFGPHPVRVLIATVHPPQNAPREALWRALLTSLADEAADGKAIVFEGAGHGLQFERVEGVANEIIAVLPAGASR